MKTKELMIGDWVLANGKNTQVVWIGNLQKLAVRGFPSEFFEDEIEPIPLTPKILEKNGFKWLLTDSKSITYCINKPTINASKNKESGEWLICVGPSGSTKKRFVEISCVKYVHELQHALRLCKVEKEIVL